MKTKFEPSAESLSRTREIESRYGKSRLMARSAIFLLGLIIFPTPGRAQISDSVKTDTLGFAEVTARHIRHQGTRDILTVNNRIRNRHINALSMLKEFPAVRYNPINEQIRINGTDKIAYQINGTDKSAEDIKNLPPDAIGSIELQKQADGKYAADGIRYVVKVNLKESYKGLDLSVRNFLIVSPNGNNGDNAVACEQPNLNLQYRSNDWNINATAAYGHFDWNFPITLQKDYGSLSMTSAQYTPRHPNQNTTRNEFAYRFSADHTINRKHTLAFNALYNPARNKEHTVYQYLTEPAGTERTEENRSANDEDNLKFNASYQGPISEAWNLDVNMGFNYADYDNAYFFAAPELESRSAAGQDKRYYYGRVAARNTGLEHWTFDIGAVYTGNRYRTWQSGTKTRINTDRYNIFASGTYTPTETWSLRAGLSGAGLHSSFENRFLLQPTFNISHASQDEKFGLDLEYAIVPAYPKLYQLSEAAYKVDQMITHKGNPWLKPLSNNHRFNGSMNFGNWLLFENSLEYNRNSIADHYFRNEGEGIVRSYKNARYLQDAFSATFSFDLSSSFSAEAMLGFHYSMMKNNAYRRHKTSLIADITLNYYNEKKAFLVSMDYSKNKIAQCMLQGARETGQDILHLTLQKLWLKGRLRGQLIYVLPVHWGLSSYQNEYVNTDFYSMRQRLNLRTYDNMIFFRLTYQLHKGKKTKRLKDSSIYDDENKAGRDLIGQ